MTWLDQNTPMSTTQRQDYSTSPIPQAEIGQSYNILSVQKYIRDVEIKDYFNPKGYKNNLGIEAFPKEDHEIYKVIEKQMKSKVRKVQAAGAGLLLMLGTYYFADDITNSIELDKNFKPQLERTIDLQ